MSIIRTVHNKENPYAQLSKAVINDNKLSFKALGLWVWAMSKPNDWTFYIDQISKDRKEGKKAVYAMISELIEHGYCFKVQHRQQEKEGGKFHFGAVEYFFFEYVPTSADLEELKKSFPHCHFGKTQVGQTQKAPLQKTDLRKKKDISKQQQQSQPPEQKKEEPSAVVVVSSFQDVSKALSGFAFEEAMLASFCQYPIYRIQSAVALVKRSKKPIENVLGFLRAAIEKGWKPAESKNIPEEKENTLAQLIEKNKREAEKLENRYRLQFKYNHCFQLSSHHIDIITPKGSNSIGFAQPDCMESLQSFIAHNFKVLK